jgi:formylglycine-generating enzyme required for sulfatase activity
MQMVFIPSGLFYMGGVDTDAQPDEKPPHNVTIPAFWMDKLEVTNGMYSLCVKDGKCKPPREFQSATRKSYFGNPDFTDFPVIHVSWLDAKNYCEWAGRRLPTEAEWEYAARGSGDYRRYPWGEQSPDNNLANYDYGVRDTNKVGSYPSGASPFGILDMAGNVWEWVADYYDPRYYEGQPSQNPSGPSVAVGQGLRRVIRGGSWVEAFRDLRVSNRGYASSPDLSADSKSEKYKGDANDHTGIRCAANGN